MNKIEKTSSQDELEQLIEMAEKVSINAQKLEDRYSILMLNISFISLFILGFTFTIYLSITQYSELNQYREYLTLVIFLTIIFSTFYIFYKYKERKKVYAEIYREKLILRKLLNMISSFKDLAYEDISIVSKAVIEMRLNRIQFSVGDRFIKNKNSSRELHKIDIAIDNILGDYVQKIEKKEP